jgi:predicted amidohydrolase
VGSEDGVTFFGGSHVVNPMGRKVTEAALFQEELLIADLDLSAVRRARLQTPILRDENLDLTIRELKRIRRERYEGGNQR